MDPASPVTPEPGVKRLRLKDDSEAKELQDSSTQYDTEWDSNLITGIEEILASMANVLHDQIGADETDAEQNTACTVDHNGEWTTDDDMTATTPSSGNSEGKYASEINALDFNIKQAIEENYIVHPQFVQYILETETIGASDGNSDEWTNALSMLDTLPATSANEVLEIPVRNMPQATSTGDATDDSDTHAVMREPSPSSTRPKTRQLARMPTGLKRSFPASPNKLRNHPLDRQMMDLSLITTHQHLTNSLLVCEAVDDACDVADYAIHFVGEGDVNNGYTRGGASVPEYVIPCLMRSGVDEQCSCHSYGGAAVCSGSAYYPLFHLLVDNGMQGRRGHTIPQIPSRIPVVPFVASRLLLHLTEVLLRIPPYFSHVELCLNRYIHSSEPSQRVREFFDLTFDRTFLFTCCWKIDTSVTVMLCRYKYIAMLLRKVIGQVSDELIQQSVFNHAASQWPMQRWQKRKKYLTFNRIETYEQLLWFDSFLSVPQQFAMMVDILYPTVQDSSSTPDSWSERLSTVFAGLFHPKFTRWCVSYPPDKQPELRRIIYSQAHVVQLLMAVGSKNQPIAMHRHIMYRQLTLGEYYSETPGLYRLFKVRSIEQLAGLNAALADISLYRAVRMLLVQDARAKAPDLPVQHMVTLLFEPELLAQCTWTGRNMHADRRPALGECCNLIQLLIDAGSSVTPLPCNYTVVRCILRRHLSSVRTKVNRNAVNVRHFLVNRCMDADNGNRKAVTKGKPVASGQKTRRKTLRRS